MHAQTAIPFRAYLLATFAFLFGPFFTGCAPTLLAPTEPNSSLVIGRVTINNQNRGAFYGALPLGVVESGIVVEVESRDKKQIFKATTEDQGYFFLPNLPPNIYYIRRVIFEGSLASGETEKSGYEARRLTFTPVPGKISYAGTLIVDISERGLATIREVRDEDKVKAYFYQKYAASPWAAKEFVTASSSLSGMEPAPEKASQKTERQRGEAKPVVRAGLKAEKPEWKVGYQWVYAWKHAGKSGTSTQEIVREEVFESIPSYVVKQGKNEDYYA